MRRRGEGRGVDAVEAEIEAILVEGEVEPGRELPSERLLSSRLGVARGTVRAALQRLEARGLVELQQGRRPRIPTGRSLLSVDTAPLLLGRGPYVPLARHHCLAALLEARRLTAVSSMALCCETPSTSRLDAVQEALWDLREDVLLRQHPERALRSDFALWAAAATAARSSGLLLLVRSLEQAFLSMEHLLVPSLPLHRMRQWVEALSGVLYRRDAVWVRQELPGELEACDRLVHEELSCPRERQLQEHLRKVAQRVGTG